MLNAIWLGVKTQGNGNYFQEKISRYGDATQVCSLGMFVTINIDMNFMTVIVSEYEFGMYQFMIMMIIVVRKIQS